MNKSCALLEYKPGTVRVVEYIQGEFLETFSHMMSDDWNEIIRNTIGLIKEALSAKVLRGPLVRSYF